MLWCLFLYIYFMFMLHELGYDLGEMDWNLEIIVIAGAVVTWKYQKF